MATASRHVCRSLLQVSRRVPTKRNPSHALAVRAHAPRAFSALSTRFAGEARSNAAGSSSSASRQGIDVDSIPEPDEYLSPSAPVSVQDLDPQARADFEVLSKPDQTKYLALQNHYRALVESAEGDEVLDRLADEIDREMDREDDPIDFPTARARGPEVGFWAEDEEDEFGEMADEDDDFRDEYITSVAESELELHREVREYTRIAAWDMPLLGRTC